MRLSALIEFCYQNDIDPEECELVLREECSNGDLDFEHFDKPMMHKKGEVEIPHATEDSFVTVPIALSIEKREYPDGWDRGAPWGPG